MIGRRRPDTPQDSLPDDLQRGDYWKLLDVSSGEPVQENHPSNLTGTAWMVCVPMGDREGFSVATLRLHTVREHEDGTISVRPGDGSSNSILTHGANGQSWHGYIEHGEFTTA